MYTFHFNLPVTALHPLRNPAFFSCVTRTLHHRALVANSVLCWAFPPLLLLHSHVMEEVGTEKFNHARLPGVALETVVASLWLSVGLATIA